MILNLVPMLLFPLHSRTNGDSAGPCKGYEASTSECSTITKGKTCDPPAEVECERILKPT